MRGALLRFLLMVAILVTAIHGTTTVEGRNQEFDRVDTRDLAWYVRHRLR